MWSRPDLEIAPIVVGPHAMPVEFTPSPRSDWLAGLEGRHAIQGGLDTCQNHGQCCFVAPAVFSLDEETRELVFRREAEHTYVSGEIEESLQEDVSTAADMCPTQAIAILD